MKIIDSIRHAILSIPFAKSLHFNLSGRKVVWKYLKGNGLEVGALTNPFLVPNGVHVKYVDRMTIADLKKQYPELEKVDLIEPDILDDGETLSSVQNSSQDFIIASHMIEHCQNPIGTIQNFLRVVKKDGIVFMAVPDKRYTFDIDRPLTSIDHLLDDYQKSPELSKYSHFKEWVDLVISTKEKVEDSEQMTRQLMDIDYSIHYHVWNPSTFKEMLLHLQSQLYFSFDIDLFIENNKGEFLVVLRKC
jgi:predicted SAM-dependent methyltransferase